MHKLFSVIGIFLIINTCFSQDGFQFQTSKTKITIPFQLINNLIVIPVEVNSVKLNFILDTGVEKTFLLSLEDSDSIELKNIKSIKIRGLGSEESIDAYLSEKNTITVKEFVDANHDVYIVTDRDINFSAQLGIPVHGILGYDFLKNYIIEINYQKKKINIYKNKNSFSSKTLKKYVEIPITLDLGKPFINADITLNSKIINVKLLMDTGSGDALWLFQDKNNAIQLPPNYFEDYLGRGLSGSIYGNKSRIENIYLGKYSVNLPNTSFPDSLYTNKINSKNDRNGSIGGEILKRFNTILDYKNQKIYIKANSYFLDKFEYNMSGLEIQHNGVNWVKEEVLLKTRLSSSEIRVLEEGLTNIRYQFALKPVYEISSVRKNSPGEKVGLLIGDIITRINNVPVFRLSLQEINKLLQSEEGRTITIEVERNNKISEFKFQLEKLL